MRDCFHSLLTLCVIFICSIGQATIFTVQTNGNAGTGSLRESISQATSGDTIEFAVSGIIFLDSQIVLNKNLSILGPGADVLSISGKQETRLFFVEENDTILIRSLALIDGNTYSIPLAKTGAAIFCLGHLSLENCLIQGHESQYGGAIGLGQTGSNSRLFLDHCSFVENTATPPDSVIVGTTPLAGGAIYMEGREGSARAEAINCTFSNNSATLTGGAVFMIGDEGVQVSFRCTNCTFAENSAEDAGGIENFRFSVLRLQNTLMSDNSGIYPNINGQFVSLDHNLIDDDTGIDFRDQMGNPGGPLAHDIINQDGRIASLGNNGGSLPTHALSCISPAVDGADDLNAPMLDQRGAARIGTADIGAVEFDPSLDLLVSNTNNRGRGSFPQVVRLACPDDSIYLDQIQGPIYLDETINIDKNLSIFGNPNATVQLNGNDAIRIMDILNQAEVFMNNLSFRAAQPTNFGGGAIRNKGSLYVENSTFRSNRAVSGGAIANYGQGDTARARFVNCTFSGNRATLLDGGAIDNRIIDAPAYLQLLHCTIADNRAPNKGGGLYNGDSAIVSNVILANNDAPEGPDAFGSLTSEGYNLIRDIADISLSTATGDQSNVDPLLDPLGNYGGPTLSYRIPSNSPAVDAGGGDNTPDIDQRGVG
ncbi:MAG: choice-of-anchor Q domain-containing protein, partial [Bacteroidota bacterium]